LADSKETRFFRSALELLHLMEEALELDAAGEEGSEAVDKAAGSR
jgi:hypothetical protein